MTTERIFYPQLTSVIIFILFTNLFSQWTEQSFPTAEYLTKIRFINQDLGWVLGEYFLYGTIDGGNTWAVQDSIDPSGSKSGSLFIIDNSTVLYAVYDFQSSTGSGIRRTGDAGLTWETVDSSNCYYNEIEFVGSLTGFAAGSDSNYQPIIKKSTDGGMTWNTLPEDFSPSSYEITGVSFITPTLGWAVTYDALVFKTIDGGMNWVFQDSIGSFGSTSGPLRDIFFINPDRGWAVGGIAGGMMLATTIDGGASWNLIQQDGSSLQEVLFLNNQSGWVAGRTYPPFISHTQNGGTTWNECSFVPVSAADINSISMIDENLGWAVSGDNVSGGKIYKTTNGGLVGIKNRNNVKEYNPAMISLEQNYPNPFNPTTNITFNLPITNKVSLKVFNLLGEEVATLVSDRLSSGSYTYEWDAGNLPSGVYLYRLETGDFVETRKMILMK